MYWGIILVSSIAFSCATEFIPEINSKLQMVPFEMGFKLRLTGTMILDFGACWVIEQALKRAYSDYRPKAIANRRPDQLKIENERRAIAAAAAAKVAEENKRIEAQKQEEKKQEMMRKLEARFGKTKS